MAKKKVVKKDSKKAVKSKSIASKLTKSVSKLTQKVVSAVSKTAKKTTPEVKPKKIEKIVKPAAKVALKSSPKAVLKATPKTAVKPAPKTLEKKSKPVEVEIEIEEEMDEEIDEVVEENTGDTLIGMAKAEMAAVKIGQTAEKVEKASKFKAIKVERGNASDEKAKWQELFKRHGKDKATTYKMTDTFESLKPIEHKILGWGFVLTNDNDRLEVLFENGIKMLISNYKPN